MVLEKVLVFRSEHGLDELWRELSVGNVFPLLAVLPKQIRQKGGFQVDVVNRLFVVQDGGYASLGEPDCVAILLTVMQPHASRRRLVPVRLRGGRSLAISARG